MTIKIWEVKDGKITSLKYTNTKGENRLIILKESIDYDDSAVISDLGKALDLVNDRVASVEKIKDELIGVTGDDGNKKDTKLTTSQKDEEIEKMEEVEKTEKIEKIEKIEEIEEIEEIEKIEEIEEIEEIEKTEKIEEIEEIEKTEKIEEIEEDKKEIKESDDNILDKEYLEKELSQIEKKFGLSPEEFYEALNEGKIHGFEGTRLGTYYELYLEYYGPYKTKEKDSKDDKENENEWPWPSDDNEDGDKKESEINVPHEVKDKLDALLQIDNKGQRDAVQYLIQKYAKNRDNVKSSKDISNEVQNSESDTSHGLSLVPKEDVARVGRARGKAKEKGEPYKMYDVAVSRFIPDILEKIESSKDKMIRVRVSDMAKQLGAEFINKKPVTLYTGLKYTLFDHNIIVEMGRLKSIDPETGENIRVLKMRMKNPGDKLPPSLTKRRGESESEQPGQEDKSGA